MVLRNYILLIIVATCGLSATLPGVAEDRKASELFEPNFTDKIMEGKGKGAGTEIGQGDSEKRPGGINPVSTPSPMFDTPVDVAPAPSGTPDEDKRDFMSAHPVRSLGVILNAMKPDHVKEHVGELAALALKYDLPINRVLYVGPLTSPPEDADLAAIKLQGGSFKGVNELPEKYQVSRSPTWIIETDKGEILLDGFLSLDKFLNSKGQFVENFQAAN